MENSKLKLSLTIIFIVVFIVCFVKIAAFIQEKDDNKFYGKCETIAKKINGKVVYKNREECYIENDKHLIKLTPKNENSSDTIILPIFMR